MTIKKVSIIGLGALGILYAEHFTTNLPKNALQVIADKKRIARYTEEGIYCNDLRYDFNYIAPEDITEASDLIIVATKFDGLEEAIQAITPAVGKDTVILSVINGIISEEVIAATFGYEHVIYCVAQGMDALKKGNHMSYVNKGVLCIGADHPSMDSEAVKKVADFFTETKLPFEIDDQMRHRLWGKFMLNVGVNQAVASIEGTFADVFKKGEPRTIMISAMEEVLTLANLEGVKLTKDDLNYWLDVLATLNPDGKPSMAQDVEAKRKSELPLFAGTVLKLAEKHHVDVPYNAMLYSIIKEKEMKY